MIWLKCEKRNNSRYRFYNWAMATVGVNFVLPLSQYFQLSCQTAIMRVSLECLAIFAWLRWNWCIFCLQDEYPCKMSSRQAFYKDTKLSLSDLTRIIVYLQRNRSGLHSSLAWHRPGKKFSCLLDQRVMASLPPGTMLRIKRYIDNLLVVIISDFWGTSKFHRRCLRSFSSRATVHFLDNLSALSRYTSHRKGFIYQLIASNDSDSCQC